MDERCKSDLYLDSVLKSVTHSMIGGSSSTPLPCPKNSVVVRGKLSSSSAKPCEVSYRRRSVGVMAKLTSLMSSRKLSKSREVNACSIHLKSPHWVGLINHRSLS